MPRGGSPEARDTAASPPARRRAAALHGRPPASTSACSVDGWTWRARRWDVGVPAGLHRLPPGAPAQQPRKTPTSAKVAPRWPSPAAGHQELAGRPLAACSRCPSACLQFCDRAGPAAAGGLEPHLSHLLHFSALSVLLEPRGPQRRSKDMRTAAAAAAAPGAVLAGRGQPRAPGRRAAAEHAVLTGGRRPVRCAPGAGAPVVALPSVRKWLTRPAAPHLLPRAPTKAASPALITHAAPPRPAGAAPLPPPSPTARRKRRPRCRRASS